jgi:hypothetical protein
MAKSISVWDGTQFVPANVPVGAVPNAVAFYTSASPTNAQVGTAWFDTNTGKLKIYSGSSWIEVSVDLSEYAQLSGATFAGIITAPNYDIGLTTLNSDSIALNFSAETGLYTRSAAGTITFTASNYRAGAIKTVRIIPGASNRNLNFPTNWVFVGTKPTTVLANKVGILSVTSFGTTEADCVAAWAVQA